MKAYILKTDDPISEEYAKTCAISCDNVGLPWEYFLGFQGITGRSAWLKTGIKMNFTTTHGKNINSSAEKAECCSASHAAIWKKIANGPDEIGIILEHDAIMLHPLTIHIPDDIIAVLGYKIKEPIAYNHINAGLPLQLIDVDGHEGAHAYAITKKTAKKLLDEIENRGLLGCIDNAYFLPRQRKTKVNLKIVSPTPAIGWIRKSTIWNQPSVRNTPFIKSFRDNYTE